MYGYLCHGIFNYGYGYIYVMAYSRMDHYVVQPHQIQTYNICVSMNMLALNTITKELSKNPEKKCT